MKIEFNYIDTTEKLREYLTSVEGASILGLDTETTGLDPYSNKLRLLQIADGKWPVAVIDMLHIDEDGRLQLAEFLSDVKRVKVFQNAKFDLKFLKAHGFEVKGPIFDTMLAAQLVWDGSGPSGFGLDALVLHYLDIFLPKEAQKSDWSSSLSANQLEYAARDAAVLLPLRDKLVEIIREDRLIEVCKLEFECVRAIVDMELSGIGLDHERWGQLASQYTVTQKVISKRLNEELGEEAVQFNLFGEEVGGGINLDSPAQVLEALKRKGVDVASTSHWELAAFKERHEVVRLFLEYRRVSKALQSFLMPIPQHVHPVTRRIHSNYWQLGAHSGRFSCGNPNIQQIPRGKEFRECFIPSAGNKFIIADYSQIELRVAAEIAQDETMIAAYRKGEDLHTLTAALMAGKKMPEVTKQERQAAKAVNFGLIYAMGARGLQGYAQSVYGIDMTLEEAELFRKRFFSAYRGIAAWHSKMKKAVNIRETRTLSGRRCIFGSEPGITGLLNTPVQGTAADIAKKALGLLVSELEQLKGHIVATVHDEILLEVPANKAEEAAGVLKAVMERAGACYLKKVPVVAETSIADSWAEK